MPKRKSYSGRSRTRNSRSLLRALRFKPKRSTASRALSMAKQVKKMVNKTIANKQVNFVKAATFINNVGYDSNNAGDLIQPFLSEGAQDGNTTASSSARIGNEITLLRTKMHFNFDVAATGEQYNKFRIIICESTEGAVALGLGDVLYNGALPFSSMYSTKTSTNKRYKIHYDKIFEVNRYQRGSKQLSLTLKYGKTGRVVHYDGTAPSPIDYKLSVFIVSDSAVAPHPSMEYTLRHTYKDA